jgi:hypothetical protein
MLGYFIFPRLIGGASMKSASVVYCLRRQQYDKEGEIGDKSELEDAIFDILL